MHRSRRRTWNETSWLELVVAVLLAVLWFSATQHRLLMEPDEGRYAEIPREMLTSGDWVMPRLDGIEYLEKPPLQYWATATAYKLFGITQGNSRLWTVTLGYLGLWVIYGIGRRQYGLAAGRMAALIAASCPLYVFISQINVLDMGLAFFLTCALGAFLRAQQPAADRRWMWACWLSLALGFLQKGLVAFALPAIALVFYSLLQRDLQLWQRLQLRAGALIAGLVVAPWLILMSLREPGFLQFFFVHEHLLRYTTTIHARVEPWWFFIAVLLVGILPWLGTIARSLPLAWQEQTRPGEFNTSRFLLIWAASIMLFYSLSGSKLTPYIVPAIAPLALLGGMCWARRDVGAWRAPPVFFPLALAAACIAARWTIPLVVPAGSVRDSYGDFASWLAVAGVLICVTVAVAYALARRRPASTNARQSSTALLAIGSCAALTLIVASTNTLEPARGGPSISAALRPYLQLDRPFYCVGMYPQTVIFALGKTCVLVGYHGELETQLDGGASHWLPTLHDFRERWTQEPDAVAIVDPADMQKLGLAGVTVHGISRSASAVVVNNPGSQNLRGAPLTAADQKLTRKNISGPRVSSAN